MSLPKVTFDTFRTERGSTCYRIYLDGALCLTSGPFLCEKDAESCGRHIANDPEAVAYLLKDHSP